MRSNLLRSLRQSYDCPGLQRGCDWPFDCLSDTGYSFYQLAVACRPRLSGVHEEIVLQSDAHVSTSYNGKRIHRELKPPNSRRSPCCT